MRKVFAVLFLVLMGSIGYCGEVMYSDTLTDQSGIVSNAAYSLNVYSKGIDYLSMQAIYAPITPDGIYCSTNSVNTTLDTITSTVTYVLGYSVLYSSQSFSFGGLTNNTTYFVIPYLTGYIQLATTKANAISGTAVNITTSSFQDQPYAGTFTLTPVSAQLSNPATVVWQGSNDNSNWCNLNVSSLTIVGATTTTSTGWDFGYYTYKYIRAYLTAGQYGAFNFKAIGFGKQNR